MDRTVEPNTYAALDAFMASELGDETTQHTDGSDDFECAMGSLVLEHGAAMHTAATVLPLMRRSEIATRRMAWGSGVLAVLVLVAAVAWVSGDDEAAPLVESVVPPVESAAAPQQVVVMTVDDPEPLLTDIAVTAQWQPIASVEAPNENVVPSSATTGSLTAELLSKQTRLERDLAAARKAAAGAEAQAKQLQDELAKMRAVGETAMRRASESEAIIERALGNPANRTLTVVATLGDGVILRDAAGGEVIAPLGGRVRVNPDSGRAALEISAR